jgi:hypothetical protein
MTCPSIDEAACNAIEHLSQVQPQSEIPLTAHALLSNARQCHIRLSMISAILHHPSLPTGK